MADLYKMLAALMVFVLFIGIASAGVAIEFPGSGSNGPDPNAIPSALQPTVDFSPTPQQCTDFFTAIACSVGSGVSTFINAISIPFKMLGALISTFIGVGNFYLPDMASNPLTAAIGVLVITPVIIVISLAVFFIIKSVVPFVGGSPDA